MNEAFIAGAVRTPVGSFNGALSQMPAIRLGSLVIQEAVRKSRLSPEDVDIVSMGIELSAGLGPGPARQAALGAGLPKSVRTITINSGSGLQAVLFAVNEILSGEADIAAAGGMESMSLAPYLLEKARFGYRLGHSELIDPVIKDCLWDVYNNVLAGESAERLAARYRIGRDEQDRYALQSYSRAIGAERNGLFDPELVPITIPLGMDKFASANMDEGPQKFDHERLSALAPLYRDGGTITSGNSSGIADGASAVTVISGRMLKHLGITPLARFSASASIAMEPEMHPLAAGKAIEKLVKKAGLGIDGIDLFEINEDYSVSVLAAVKEMGIDESRLNVNGGAVAMGNPAGAGGARILTTLLHAMEIREAKRGVAALSTGSGEAIAVLVERIGKYFNN